MDGLNENLISGLIDNAIELSNILNADNPVEEAQKSLDAVKGKLESFGVDISKIKSIND